MNRCNYVTGNDYGSAGIIIPPGCGRISMRSSVPEGGQEGGLAARNRYEPQECGTAVP
jgi:hypothetical protein